MKNVFVRTDLIKPLTGEELSVLLALNKLCNDEKFGFNISLQNCCEKAPRYSAS